MEVILGEMIPTVSGGPGSRICNTPATWAGRRYPTNDSNQYRAMSLTSVNGRIALSFVLRRSGYCKVRSARMAVVKSGHKVMSVLACDLAKVAGGSLTLTE